MKTGLLSLNIHDSLTFDGAELCLHPDLLVVPGDVAVSSQHTAGSRKLDDGKSSGATTNSGNTTSASTTLGLSVGDMIEIRVWDPLPKEQAILKNPGSSSAPVFRKHRTSPPGNAGSKATSVQVEFLAPINNTANGASMAGSPSVAPVPADTTMLRPRADSLAYSVGDTLEEGGGDNRTASAARSVGDAEASPSDTNKDQPSVAAISVLSAKSTNSAGATIAIVSAPVAAGDNDGGSVDTPPTRTVAMPPSALPPVFPRSRAGTADIPGTTPNVKGGTGANSTLPKPPLIHRRVTAGSVGVSTSQQHSPKFVRGHSRSISDMTMDTQHLDIIEAGYHHADSHDEDDHGGYFGGDEWSKVSLTHKLRLSFVLLVTDNTVTSLKGNTRTQVSMLRQVADLYSLSSYDMVTVHKIDPHDHHEVLKAVSADFVVMTIKDQFISRGDMHLFQRGLQKSWIYEGQRLTEKTRLIKAHALEIRHGNDAAKSGIITEQTMITFRSRSARIIWLVQLSSEMWDYASPYDHKGDPHSICDIYFDKWVRFLYKLFAKWKALEVTHSLTVVFFSRTFLGNGQASPLRCRDVYGRNYEDHYKPVIENETCTEWESLIARIKEEFVKYPLEVGWNLTDRRPSNASQGNVLEAVNVTLNIMQYHFLDRDLYRTGNSIVVVSPGCGVFEVDKELAGITYQRMMDNGIGSDMLSLGLPPLHIAPFFLYNNEFRNVETQGVDTSETYYEVPHWMHLSFISYDREENQLGDHIHQDDMVSPVVKQEGLGTFELGPNGFLIPKGEAKAGLLSGSPRLDPKSPSSFSALGNRAATPGRAKAQQERKLISGRDFRDILEACRPRVSGMKLPSALASILKQNDFELRKDETRESVPDKHEGLIESDTDLPLREWGTVHFTSFPFRSRTKIQPESPASRRSLSVVHHDKTEESENASNASSFMSHVSSVFGMSYDRVIWDHYDSPLAPMSSFKIQRSPSLEFDKVRPSLMAEGESRATDDALWPGSDSASSGRASGSRRNPGMAHIEHDATSSHHSRADRHAEKLRALMDAHDEHVWAPMSAKLSGMGDNNVIRPESIQHVESEVTIASKQVNQNAPGGLGAALSQYNGPTSTTKEAQPTTLLTRRASAGYLTSQGRNFINLDRNRAQSPRFPSITQLQERSVRGLSPMLLPSALPTSSRIAATHSNDLPAKSTFERATDIPVHINRLVSTGRPLQHSREGLVSNSVFSGSSSYQNVLSTMPPVETKRHYIRPLGRSPPSAGIRHASRGLLNNGYTGDASIRALGASPPSVEIPRQGSARPWEQDSPALNPQRKVNRSISPSTKTGPVNRTKKRDNASTSKYSMRQQKACNPFRQSDEDEVLAKKSHNRRRWSHVFPAGEIEFKRHSGPIWNSLTAPAILPLSVDYIPSPQELRDEGTFQFNPYTVTLGGIENKHYSTHAELLLEMVRQRVAQDFQIVTDAAVKESEMRTEPQRLAGRNKVKPGRAPGGRPEAFVPSLPTIKHEATGTIKHYLSMGHRIQVLSYDPSADTIEIVAYNRKSAQNNPINVYAYTFMVYSRIAEEYSQSFQTFKKYADPYKWNRVDNLICGEEDRQLEVGMRFRRVMFGLIPESFRNSDSEQDYISKFKRLLEYLGKLREKSVEDMPLDVKIITSKDPVAEIDDIFQVRAPSEDSMIKLTIPLKRLKRDPFEWMEIAIGSTFDTRSSYRIMFNWLVASSAKVETQVQLFLRRCSQFGLQTMSFPQTTISRDLFLHSFAVPTLLTLRDKELSDQMIDELRKMDFIYDGTRFTNGQVLDRVERSQEFDFPKYRNGKVRGIPSRQYVHRSGALFIRYIRDRQGWSILVGIENHRQSTSDGNLRITALELLRNVARVVDTLSVMRANTGTINERVEKPTG